MSVQVYFENNLLQRALDHAKIVALDMNGLIVDDEQVQLESVNRALLNTGLRLSEEYWIDRCVGKRADEYFTEILRERACSFSDSVVSRLVAEKNRLYRDLIVKRVHDLTRPGVVAFIDYLVQAKHTPLALCTSAHPQEIESILGEKGLKLKDRFSHILSGLDVTKSKPDPETYRTLAAVTDCDPADCLVFEDSGLGVTSAVEAGMVCIAVPNRFTLHHHFDGAFAIIESLRCSTGTIVHNRF
jgi:HAD superfamily hydrolase (TIGR01509 family)